MHLATPSWAFGLRLRMWTIRVGLLCLLALLTTSVMPSSIAHAAQTIPYKVNFQGRLTNASGNIMPDGLYNMKIRIFNALTGGTSLGEEVRDGGFRVQVTNGLFSIQIGDNSLLAPSAFTSYPLYIEVELPTPATANCTTVGCATWTEGAMTPRSPMGSAPYAFNADTVDGIDGSEFAQLNQPNTFSVTSPNTYNGDIQINKQATFGTSAPILFNAYYNPGGQYIMQNAGTSAFLYNDTSGLRIGASPANAAGGLIGNSSDILTVKASNIFVKGAIDSGVTYGENQISNPGFEFDCTAWSSGCDSSTASPRSGQKSSVYVQPAATSSRFGQSRYIAVQPGETVYGHGYIKTTAATTGTGGFFVAFYDGVNSAAMATVPSANTNPGTSYTLRSVTAVAPAGAVYATIGYANNGDGTTAGTWYYDDMYGENVTRLSPAVFRNSVNSTTAFLIQDASATPVFMVDTTNNAIKIGGADVSPNATPTLFVVDHKSTAGDPVGVNGGMYYNANTSKFRCYEANIWKDCIAATSTGSVPTARKQFTYINDFVSTNMTNNSIAELSYLASGTSTSITPIEPDPGRIGEVAFNSGTTATGRVALGSGASTNTDIATNVLFLGNNAAWTANTAVFLPALSTSAQEFSFRFGFIDKFATESVDGCFFRYARGTSVNWQGVCRNNSVERTCDTLKAVAASTYADLKLAVNSAGTQAAFVVDDAATGAAGNCSITDTAGIPTAAGRMTGYGMYLQKSAGTTGVSIYTDYIDIRGENLPR